MLMSGNESKNHLMCIFWWTQLSFKTGLGVPILLDQPVFLVPCYLSLVVLIYFCLMYVLIIVEPTHCRCLKKNLLLCFTASLFTCKQTQVRQITDVHHQASDSTGKKSKKTSFPAHRPSSWAEKNNSSVSLWFTGICRWTEDREWRQVVAGIGENRCVGRAEQHSMICEGG